MDQPSERRRHPRYEVSRPCKVHHPSTRRYEPAETLDVAAGGLLMHLDSSRPLAPGDRVEVVVAWDDSVILASDAQIPAKVVRVIDSDEGGQTVACAFERAALAVTLAAAA